MKNPEILLNDLKATDAWIRALALRLVKDHNAADDLAQDTWVAALESPPENEGAVRPWLSKVARRLLIARHRSVARRNEREKAAAKPESLPSVAELRDEEAIRHKLALAVFSLDEPYRSAILYRYFRNMPPREIAERFEVSAVAIEGRLRRGLQQLRARLDRDFGDRKTWCTALLPLTVPTAAAGAAPTSILSGALVMSMKVKIGIAVGFLAGAGFVLWNLAGGHRPLLKDPVTREQREHPKITSERPRMIATAQAPRQFNNLSARPTHPSAQVDPPVSPKFTLTGTVRDETGRPLVDAAVQAFVAHRISVFGCIPSPAMRTRTDANGRYELGPMERKLVLEAAYPGLCRERIQVSPGSAHDFVLGVPGVLAGRVTHDLDGPPCGGAVVVACWVDRSTCAAILSGKSSRYEAVTDAGGRYRFPDLPPHSYQMHVLPPGNRAVRSRKGHEVVVKAGEETEQNWVVGAVDSGVSLGGRVLEKPTGRPIAGARVHLRSNPRQRGVTGDEGRFLIEGLTAYPHPRARHTLRVEAKGYAVKEVKVHVTGDADVEQDVLLERPARIRGTVVDPTGAPVEGARVAFAAEGTREDFWSYAGRSNAEGEFEVESRSFMTRRLFAAADGFAGGISDPIALRPGALTGSIQIRLVQGGTITGRVTDDHGQPLEAIRIHVRSKTGTRIRTGGFTSQVQTDRDGEYRLENIFPGTHDLWAEKRLHIGGKRMFDRQYLSQPVDVIDGASCRKDIVWWKGLTLSGKVSDAEGTPVADAHLRVEPLGAASSFPASTSTNSRGQFRVEKLSAGLYAITVLDRRFYSKRFEDLRAGQNGLVLRVERKRRITGRVVFAGTHLPVPRFWVQAHSSRRRFTFENKAGCFEIDPSTTLAFSRPGVHFLEVGTEDGFVTSAPVRLNVLPGKQPAPMVLSLVRGGGLSGHVKNPAGEVVSNPAVRIRRRDRDDGGGGPWFRANVGPDGHYSFGALRPGLYRLEAFAKGLAGTCPALNIQAATDTRLDVHLTVGGGIRVKVTDPDGRPGQAWISIEPLDAGLPVAENWQGTRRQTDARGNLHRVGLAPGQYRVQASSKRWVKAEEVITVSAGVDLHLPLQLTRGGSLRVTAIGPDRCPIEGVAMRMKRDGKVVLPDSAHLYTLFADSLKKNAGLNWPDFRRSFFQTGSGGTLLCSCIQPGNYVVEASKEGFKKTTSRVTILDNHESRLRLTLRQE